MNKEFNEILKERFEKDSLISIATVDNTGKPWVRIVDAIYIDGVFYTITNATTNKMKHIKDCLLYTSPSPRDRTRSRMPSSA